MAKLTHTSLKNLPEGKFVSDRGARGGGTLDARKLKGGAVQFYYRYTGPSGSRARIPLGVWSGSPGGGTLSLAEARARVEELSSKYRAGARDLRGTLEDEERETRRRREADRKAEEAAQARRNSTLRALMEAYVAQLRAQGRRSATSVASALKRHVLDHWPRLAATPAQDVTTDDLLEVVARVADAGKLREAAKIRSYLQAAYTAAVRARQSAQALPELRNLKITSNPARDLVPITGASNAGDRALSLAELRAYWRRIEAMPGAAGAALRFHLLTGGQRIEQLAALTLADFDSDQHTVTLKDGKGRRVQPRKHVVPLTPTAEEAMWAMAPERLGDHLVTLTQGRTGVGGRYLREALQRVVSTMAEAGELEKGPFTLRDLRRTVETRLAAAGVSAEVRAQLQSHGLGGVQARHYDRHDYLDEKRDALGTLYRLLTEEGAKVVPLRRAG